MSKSDSDGSSENEWDDRGELAWNEFDWENYLRTQEGQVAKYLKFYEKSASKQDRIDVVAQQMGWDQDSWSSDEDDEAPSENDTSAESDDTDDSEPYTVQKNPIFIATKAIYLSLNRVWEKHAVDPAKSGNLSRWHSLPRSIAARSNPRWPSMRWTLATTPWQSACSNGPCARSTRRFPS